MIKRDSPTGSSSVSWIDVTPLLVTNDNTGRRVIRIGQCRIDSTNRNNSRGTVPAAHRDPTDLLCQRILRLPCSGLALPNDVSSYLGGGALERRRRC